MTYLLEEGDPKTYKEAVTSPDGPMWKEAIKSEIDSILQNHTWELVDLPPGCKALGSKWVFKKKLKPDGTIEKYKARLVIKGYKQQKGLDYFDTYSPVTRITSIRMMFAIAAMRNLTVHQMDVKTAFLNEDIDDEIYMEQPEGFAVPGQERKLSKRGLLYKIKITYVGENQKGYSDKYIIVYTNGRTVQGQARDSYALDSDFCSYILRSILPPYVYCFVTHTHKRTRAWLKMDSFSEEIPQSRILTKFHDQISQFTRNERCFENTKLSKQSLKVQLAKVGDNYRACFPFFFKVKRALDDYTIILSHKCFFVSDDLVECFFNIYLSLF
ncbi:hypothetical protein DCAR_0934351 [Daucus carota subsp. sativus]|uniref:Reverse transcriptase Ty1/copia-type domain-containing protein n=1 Tax=Daucus carota subsp. sativus TaxID=79200 RepID=A0AAF1BE96_DAUCS|nr:hypothetical protein DCAR_0934351 [Daucus carota subsp. sativus]